METKEHILERTFFLLLKKGYDGVSISDIQLETGMARGLLYHYFGNKHELFEKVAERFLVSILHASPHTSQNMSLPDMIDYTIRKYEDICSHRWASFNIGSEITIADYDFLTYKVMQQHDSAAAKIRRCWNDELKTWERAARTSISSGIIRDELSAETIADTMNCLVCGVWMQAVTDNSIQLIADLRNKLTGYYNLTKK